MPIYVTEAYIYMQVDEIFKFIKNSSGKYLQVKFWRKGLNISLLLKAFSNFL